jgi:tRNA wybutosine-synthesizing protein 4
MTPYYVKEFFSRETSDVLPWQCHSRYGAACQNVLFVDVDYPDLMRKKREIVLQTPQLRELLGSEVTTSESDSDPILLRSDKYCQLACDLRELEAFRGVLDSLVPLAETDVLFVAEVSITYMDTKSADELIKWASSIGRGTANPILFNICQTDWTFSRVLFT